MDILDYLTESLSGRLLAICAFRGYVTEKDICEMINKEAGTNFEGSEEVIYHLEDIKG